MDHSLILVDDNDSVIGYGEKIDIHQRRALHRAFSIYVYNQYDRTILLQKRALCKYHSGGLWSNTCCSHQYRYESVFESLRRCMNDEIGISPSFLDSPDLSDFNAMSILTCKDGTLSFVGKYKYDVSFGNLGEAEIDWVFLFTPNHDVIDKIEAVPSEVEELRWISMSELDIWFNQSPNQFTFWFKGTYSMIKAFMIKNYNKKWLYGENHQL